ncbi:MAG: hypothetical protein ACLQPH_07785 [Acidimicrobiales bacterium]
MTNHGSTPINLNKGCRPDFQVALTSKTYQPMIAFAAVCTLRPFIIRPGVNRLPVQVVTTYESCLQPDASSAVSIRKCVNNAPPPLPTGKYEAVLFGSGDLPLPEPRPVPVTLR